MTTATTQNATQQTTETIPNFPMRHAVIEGILLVRPTRADILALRVGDLAPNCFGKLARVTEIHAQQDDIKGKAFVCYYIEFGDNGSTMSGSLKEDETLATVPTTSRWKRGIYYLGDFRNAQ